ncbi:hypothetical protein CALCODRAFT_488901 [Calocera cornea HHB12733]|uniref:Uncharacterized protein n=1 Tax=Calocera cornea HHB12733 TaxID=1353952 RepID=A0A165C336_9BASI|nr:hypothetical protein CALCODRAFT_488901 [Calocera cornea HHB12733]
MADRSGPEHGESVISSQNRDGSGDESDDLLGPEAHSPAPSIDPPATVTITPAQRDKESQALLVEEKQKWLIGEGVFLIPRIDQGEPQIKFELKYGRSLDRNHLALLKSSMTAGLRMVENKIRISTHRQNLDPQCLAAITRNVVDPTNPESYKVLQFLDVTEATNFAGQHRQMGVYELWRDTRNHLPGLFGTPPTDHPHWIAEVYDEAMRATEKGEELYKALADNKREVGKPASAKNLWDRASELLLSKKKPEKQTAEIREIFNTHSAALRAFYTPAYRRAFQRVFEIPAFEDLPMNAVTEVADSDLGELWVAVLDHQCDLLSRGRMDFKAVVDGKLSTVHYPGIVDLNFWRYIDDANNNYDVVVNRATQRPLRNRSKLPRSQSPRYEAFVKEELAILYAQDGAPYLLAGDSPFDVGSAVNRSHAAMPLQAVLSSTKLAPRSKGKAPPLSMLPPAHYQVAGDFQDMVLESLRDNSHLMLVGPTTLQHFVTLYDQKYRDVIGLLGQAALESHMQTGTGGNRSFDQKRSPSAFRALALSQFNPNEGEPSDAKFDEALCSVLAAFSPVSQADLLDHLNTTAHFAMEHAWEEVQAATSPFLEANGSKLSQKGLDMAIYLAWYYASHRKHGRRFHNE